MRVAAVAGVVLVLAAAAVSASAGGVGHDGLIAFQRAVGNVNEYEIWVVRPDGSGLRRLTSAQPSGADTSPAWSPDGSTLVFTRQTRTNTGGASLYAIPAEGGTPRRLTRCTAPRCWSDSEARFSRDGLLIAFVRAERAPFYGQLRRYSVYVMNADGSGLRRLSKPPKWEGPDHAPEFTPDGRGVVFVRSGGSFVEPSTELRVVGVGNGIERRWASLPRWVVRPTAPVFSPDGTRLLVSFECRSVECGGSPNHPHRLGTVSAGGTGFRTVSRGLEADTADWSPSGRRLVARCELVRLCTLPADGREAVRYQWVTASGNESDPRFVGSRRVAWGASH